MSEKFSLEKEVQRLKGDAESNVQKYERLQKELGDTLAHSGMKDDHEVCIIFNAINTSVIQC